MTKPLELAHSRVIEFVKVSINLKLGAYDVIDPDHINFNSIGAMKSLCCEKILASFEKLEKTGCFLDYCLLQRIYFNAKKEILGKFIPWEKTRNLSQDIKDLKEKFKNAVEEIIFYKTVTTIAYAKWK